MRWAPATCGEWKAQETGSARARMSRSAHHWTAASIDSRGPEMTVWVSSVGRPHLVDPSRLEASARRLYGESFDSLFGALEPVPEQNIAVAEGDVLGWEVFPTPGHASHHVGYLRDGLLFAGDACGVRREPGDEVLPFSPPPDIDVERWNVTIDEIESRGPTRLALTHYGLFGDVGHHLARFRVALEQWAALVASGVGPEEFEKRTRPLSPELERFETITPRVQSWAGLRRYFDKRTPAEPQADRQQDAAQSVDPAR